MINVLPVVDDVENEEAMAFGVPRKRYDIFPAEYDASVGAYNEIEIILATVDDLTQARQIVQAFRASLLNYDNYFIFDNEKCEEVDAE